MSAQYKFTVAEKTFLDRAALAIIENPELSVIEAMQRVLQRDKELVGGIMLYGKEKIALAESLASVVYNRLRTEV